MKKWTQGTLFLLLVSSVLVAGCSSRTGQAGGEAPKTEPQRKQKQLNRHQAPEGQIQAFCIQHRK